MSCTNPYTGRFKTHRSRLGGRRLVFQPYSREQLKEIVLARLADAGAAAAFNPRAIEYAARKVRRMLTLLTKSVRFPDTCGQKYISWGDVANWMKCCNDALHAQLLSLRRLAPLQAAVCLITAV